MWTRRDILFCITRRVESRLTSLLLFYARRCLFFFCMARTDVLSLCCLRRALSYRLLHFRLEYRFDQHTPPRLHLSFFVAVEVTSRALPSPSLNQVIAAIYHAYFVVEEQRKAYEKCVDRQSVYCDSDIETFSATARVQSIESLALTAATLEVSRP